MDRAVALALEHGLPYTGLRGFQPDSRLFRYLPLADCLRETVIPLLLVEDRLKVASASADPDLAVLRDRFPQLDVDLVIAPAAEIARALKAAQEAAE